MWEVEKMLVEPIMQVVKVAVYSLPILDLKKVTLELKTWFKTEDPYDKYDNFWALCSNRPANV